MPRRKSTTGTSKHNCEIEEISNNRSDQMDKRQRKKKKRRSKVDLRKQELLDMKQSRIEDLVEYAMDLQNGLETKLVPYFDEDMKLLFAEEMQTIVSFYDSNLTLVNNHNTFVEKKQEIMDVWKEFVKTMREAYVEDHEEEIEERKNRAKMTQREEMMKALGINVPKTKQKNGTHCRSKKISEKQRIRRLKKQMLLEEKYDSSDTDEEEYVKPKVIEQVVELVVDDEEDEWSLDEGSDTKPRAMVVSDDDSDEDDIEVEVEPIPVRPKKLVVPVETQPKKVSKPKTKKKKKLLRSPICVVMGHVDAGKTKILDHIRGTSVQDKEAGRITQQIGASCLSTEYLEKRTHRMKQQFSKFQVKVPGLLFIDTPGHESFSNLRARGSSMCDIAVVVVDITRGLEPQTIESLKMLKHKRVPFIIALNKIDRCLDWVVDENAPFVETYNKQKKHTKKHFDNLVANTMNQIVENGWNCALYHKNKRIEKDISLVPTSAVTGEGIPDLLFLLVQLAQKFLTKSLTFKKNKFVCHVLEVKKTVGHGTTLDVILSNGMLKKGDSIVCCGMKGAPIVTDVKALLLPHEAKEMRVSGQYRSVDEVQASAGIRIAAKGLEDAVAGCQLLLVPNKIKKIKDNTLRNNAIEKLKQQVQSEFDEVLNAVDNDKRGVFVQSSTLGSLEALVTFLKKQNIPICGMGIGNIKKEDVIKAGMMLEKQQEYGCILAFNVSIQKDARVIANNMGVRIFESDVIYQLQTDFELYLEEVRKIRLETSEAVFPVELRILPQHVIMKKNPIIIGVKVTRGTLRINTPICVKKRNNALYIGKVTSIQKDNLPMKIALRGDEVAVRIEDVTGSVSHIQIGRHFTAKDTLCSLISRESCVALKRDFLKELSKDDKLLIEELWKYFGLF